MTTQENSRLQDWEKQFKQANKVTEAFAGLVSGTVESLGEFGALIPLGEIIVTIFAFSRSGMTAEFGIEVLIGLVFAQVAALFLTSHYKNIALADIGQAAVFTSILVGAINTGIAILLALANPASIPNGVLFFPAISSGIAVLCIYGAKMFTQERVTKRLILRQEADNEIAELKRTGTAQREKNSHLDSMQISQLKMQSDTMQQMAADDLIKQAYMLVMREQALKNVFVAFGVNGNSKVAKMLREQIVKANEEAIANGSIDPSVIGWPIETNGIDLIDLARGNADPNEQTH